MKPPRGPYQGTEKRRRAILEAALACFSEVGFLATTMADIRRRSGASHGSIYHHFGGKEQLAAAVYVQGIRDYQSGMLEELARHSGAKEGIAALVRYHLRWVQDHADLARYLARMRHTELVSAAEPAVAADNRSWLAALGGFFVRHVGDGTLRRLPRELYVALIFGPAQELARHWLLAGREVDVDLSISELAEAAWRALERYPRAERRRP